MIVIIATAILIKLCTARIAFPRRRRYPLPWARPQLIIYYKITTRTLEPDQSPSKQEQPCHPNLPIMP
jgi:hypothetical protein